MPLTNTAIKNAKPGDKTARLFDGGGSSTDSRGRKSGFHLAFIPTLA